MHVYVDDGVAGVAVAGVVDAFAVGVGVAGVAHV